MADHEFEITYVGEEVITTPDPGTRTMRVGQTLLYRSPAGDLDIDWVESRFNKNASKGNEEIRAEHPGTFRGECTVTTPEGKKLHFKGKGTEGKIEPGEGLIQ